MALHIGHSSWRTTSAKIDIDSVSLMSDIVNTQSSIQFEKTELALLNSIQFKIICIVLLMIQSLQSSFTGN